MTPKQEPPKQEPGEDRHATAGWRRACTVSELVYGLFVFVNIRGVALSLRMGLVFAGLAAIVLVVFYVGVFATGSFDVDKLLDVQPAEGHSDWFPNGWASVFGALPFAIWFYLAIEQLPLAAEESHNAVEDMPRALILGMFTLFGL